MKIAYCCTHTKVAPWIAQMSTLIPGAQIEDWALNESLSFGQADYAVVWAPPAKFFEQQCSLKAVFNIGAGVDSLVNNNRLPRDIPVVRLDDAGMSVQMAEYVCHAVIRFFRELNAYDAAQRDAHWQFLKPQRREEFAVGIMGLGVLGARVAQALRGFEFPVNGWSTTAKTLEGVQVFAGLAEFAGFLKATRVLVCLLPLTSETEGIINAQSLAQLQSGGMVINVARGGHVVDAELIAALDSGHLAHAVLDVFREEPLPATHAFWRHPKITVTPHTSARTLRDNSVAQIAQKLLAIARGEPVRGIVNLNRGY